MKQNKIRIHDWDQWQSYRKDRGLPPWIKLHRCLMRDAKWVSLGSHERGDLVSLWLLAADNDGWIPDDIALIQKLCYMDNPPNINKFIDLGLLDVNPQQSGVTVTSPRRQDDAPDTDTDTDTEKRERAVPADLSLLGDNDFDKAVYNWNVTAEELGLNLIKSINGDRERELTARLESFGLVGWNAALEVLEKDDFCKGNNPRKWKATFDWMVKQENLAKMMEGGYS